jgi:hypothetical protein
LFVMYLKMPRKAPPGMWRDLGGNTRV